MDTTYDPALAKYRDALEFNNRCPECGRMIHGKLEPYKGVASMAVAIERMMGVGKTHHFEGSVNCPCGRRVQVSLHVTAM